MSVTKGKRGWRVRASVRVNGRIRRGRGLAPTKEAAKALEEQLKASLRGDTLTSSLTSTDLRTFKDILDIYKAKSKHTPFSAHHESKVDRLETLLGSSDLIHLPDRLERTIGLMRAKGRNHQATRYVQIARAAYEVCVGLGALPTNPITKIRFPTPKEIARDNYVDEERAKDIVLTAAKNRRTHHIARALQFYFQVPCRRNELVRVKLRDVDVFRRRIRVHNGTTKNDQGMWKPIPPNMVRWVMWRYRTMLSLDEPLFYRKVDGQRLPLGDFKKAFHTAVKDSGNLGLRLHDTRHIAATDMLNRGTPRTVVNAVAGWKSDMLRVYYHLDTDASLSNVRWSEAPKCEPLVNHNVNQGT